MPDAILSRCRFNLEPILRHSGRRAKQQAMLILAAQKIELKSLLLVDLLPDFDILAS